MAYRFIHCADIHLDSPLRSLALRDPDLATLIADATRRAFMRIIDLCLGERVDALMLAGDLYDGETNSMKTARFVSAQFRRLHEAGIRSFIIRGNHDALSRITRELILPDSVHVFGGRAESIIATSEGTHRPVIVHGISFAQPQAPESLLPKFRAPIADATNVALLHTSLAGTPGHDVYAPCRIADLHASGMHYWGLGHIHLRSTDSGAATVVMPGMPQGRDINEAGAKSVTLVTVADDGTITVEERLTSIAQFERLTLNLDPASDWQSVVQETELLLQGISERSKSEHTIARVMMRGESAIAWQLRRDRDLLKTELDERASRIGNTWVEKLDLDAVAPPGVTQSGDPIAELREVMRAYVLSDEGFQAAAATIIEELRSQLPPESRDFLGKDEDALHAVMARLAEQGADDVLAALSARSTSEGA